MWQTSFQGQFRNYTISRQVVDDRREYGTKLKHCMLLHLHPSGPDSANVCLYRLLVNVARAEQATESRCIVPTFNWG